MKLSRRKFLRGSVIGAGAAAIGVAVGAEEIDRLMVIDAPKHGMKELSGSASMGSRWAIDRGPWNHFPEKTAQDAINIHRTKAVKIISDRAI